MTKNTVRPLTIIITFLTCMIAISAFAGPTHWGSGYPYLAALTMQDGKTELLVYEGPIRAKDSAWITRWIDRSGNYSSVLPGSIAIGDFWHADFSTEYLAVVRKDGANLSIQILQAPEMFSTASWKIISTGKLPAMDIICVTTGDLLKQKHDQLILVTKTELIVVAPPLSPASGEWSVAAKLPMPVLDGEFVGLACGDFWGEKIDNIAIATTKNGSTDLSFFSTGDGKLSLITKDAAKDLPKIAPNGLLSGDFVKDGFDVLVLMPQNPKDGFQIRVAPLKSPKDKPSAGRIYTGRSMSRQWMPGTGFASSKVVMTGRLDSFPNGTASFAVGRVFGYIESSLSTAVRKQNGYNPEPDAEIAFTNRFPTYSITAGEPNYGWPAKDEEMGYEINLKNNGQKTIAAGSGKLKVWTNTPFRNADTNPATCDKPDFVMPVKEELAPFDPMNPSYLKYTAKTKWPYSLILCGPRATWKKLNLEEVGERWFVVVLECEGDTNLRNNRYEAALHSHTYHPIFRENANLGNRMPTVKGDPCSLEYLSCKMADAITCMWERSGTTENEDVLQRAYFDGYEIGFPDDQKDPDKRLEAWRVVQDKYEGWRELDLWWGENQSWEKYDWSYCAEIHESGHLFHPLGDLYGLYVFPVWTSAAKMADGTPVQIMTHCWTPDSFSTGESMISLAACEIMKHLLVGSRGAGIERWWTVTPDKLYVRVLDRDGKPVPGAEINAYCYGAGKPSANGVTGEDGRWDWSFVLGEPTIDKVGRKHYYHSPENGLTDALTQIFTVKIDGYQDCAVLGSEEWGAPHGRHTLLYHSIVDEEGWTWDFKTNYKKGASGPAFKVVPAIMGSNVELGISGEKDATYRLYRRWEPTYIRNFIGEFKANGTELRISQDLAEPDSLRGGRFRAIYEITDVKGKDESLPRVVTVCGLSHARGVSSQADNKLLVATNSGIANPFCVLIDGATYIEYFYHYRFGHTALKVVQSRLIAGKYYITLEAADMAQSTDYRFDIAGPLSEAETGYNVRHELGGMRPKAASKEAPFTLTMTAEDAAKLHPGDEIDGRRVLKVTGDTVEIDKQLFAPEQTDYWCNALRTAGRIGKNAEMRELNGVRGLATILLAGKEYIILADTANNRIVVWDGGTGYVTNWESQGAMPAAIASHPTEENKFFAIDRQADNKSKLYLFSFDGTALKVEPGYPVAVDVGKTDEPVEMGLAAASEPGTGTLFVAVTDANRGRILELKKNENSWETAGTYTKAIGTFAGKAELEKPTDAAYIIRDGKLQLFAVDGGNRLVRVR